jgi:hypothetical protein
VDRRTKSILKGVGIRTRFQKGLKKGEKWPVPSKSAFSIECNGHNWEGFAGLLHLGEYKMWKFVWEKDI